MKKLMLLVVLLVVLLAGMVLVQGCVDKDEVEKQAQKDIQQIKDQANQKETNTKDARLRDREAMEQKKQKQPKQWTSADIFELECLKEETLALQRIVSNESGKWNAEMIRQCQIELHQKEAALSTLRKKYQ